MRRLFLTMITLTALVQTALLADAGRIPIYQPTTITQPGYYSLTRDISSSASPVISIQADNVTLDLNGYSVSNSSASATLIRIVPPSTNVRIRNGWLSGGSLGIGYQDNSALTRVLIESVDILNSIFGIQINPAEHVEVLSSRIIAAPGSNGNGIVVQGFFSGGTFQPWTGRFSDNTIVGVGGRGMDLDGLSGGAVRRNIVRNYGALAPGGGEGIFIFPGGGNFVEENEISNGNAGIFIGSDGNVVAGNIVKNIFGTTPAPKPGIGVSGARNLIERNQLEGNVGCGINFPFALGNAYRNNMLRGNTGGAVCGAANTDAGGNLP